MKPEERQALVAQQKTPENRCTMTVCSRPSRDGTSPRDCYENKQCRRRAQSDRGDRFGTGE